MRRNSENQLAKLLGLVLTLVFIILVLVAYLVVLSLIEQSAQGAQCSLPMNVNAPAQEVTR